MDIKQLKFLIALDETRHFGQAAARCHITQPTLSMRLRSLEEELDLDYPGEPLHADYSVALASQYFNLRKLSIFGGSNEIQKNIVAKMILEL